MPAKVGLSARYMTRFRCLASDCEATCCGGGAVPVEESTHRRLTVLADDDAVASELLTRGIELTPEGPDFAPLRFLPSGECSLLDDADLCRIQSRFGRELPGDIVEGPVNGPNEQPGAPPPLRERLTVSARWVVLGALVGVLCGAASALFLWLLERATSLRLAHQQLVFALPVAGLVIGFFYERFGQAIKAGSNLVIDTIHDDGPELPLRLAPMVLLGTVLTHVFGGSAGREGTAVQMGAGLADFLAQRLRLDRGLRRQLLVAGAAGGFGSVFGTPLAGAVFGLEFIVLGRVEYRALVPALVASVIGDLTTRAFGIHHTLYPAVHALPLTPLLLAKWLIFAAGVAAVTVAFVELIHLLKRHGERMIPRLPVRMCLGGVAVVGMWQLVGTSDYLGLGVPTIVRAFSDPNLPAAAFALKLLFTVVTLAAGFLGGEVTPLFFVGAALGNVLARLLGIPLELGAGVGLAAVFAAAANTPLALSIMAVELLGAPILPHAAIVCVVAYVLSGHRGIYSAQRRP